MLSLRLKGFQGTPTRRIAVLARLFSGRSALGGHERAREELAALVRVERQAAEQIAENLAILIAPLRNTELERRASSACSWALLEISPNVFYGMSCQRSRLSAF